MTSKIKNPGVCDQQCLIDKNAFFYDMDRQSLAIFLGRDPHSIDNFLSTITKDCSIHLHDNPRSNMFFFPVVCLISLWYPPSCYCIHLYNNDIAKAKVIVFLGGSVMCMIPSANNFLVSSIRHQIYHSLLVHVLLLLFLFFW